MILDILCNKVSNFPKQPPIGFEKKNLCNNTRELIVEFMDEYKKCIKSPIFSVVPCVTYKERYIRLMYKYNQKCNIKLKSP